MSRTIPGGARRYVPGTPAGARIDAHHVLLLELKLRCRWSVPRCYRHDRVELITELSRPLDGPLELRIYAHGGPPQPIETLAATARGGVARVPWRALHPGGITEVANAAELSHPSGAARPLRPGNVEQLIFEARFGEVAGRSGQSTGELLTITHSLSVTMLDDEHQPIADTDGLVTLADGQQRPIRLGADGAILIEHVPDGPCTIDLDDETLAPTIVHTVIHPSKRRRVRAARMWAEALPVPDEVLERDLPPEQTP